MEKLELFVGLLKKENQQQNLVSRGSLEHIWLRHIADSAQLLRFVPRGTSWLDLGSGAGLPGVILSLLRPQDTVTLVESRTKRIEWLERIVTELTLPNCDIRGDRLENLDTTKVGAISARAFAPLPRLIQLAERFSTKDTIWVLPKGRSAIEELDSLPKRLKNLFHVEQSLTSENAGILVGTGL